jgi:hypothetical protein
MSDGAPLDAPLTGRCTMVIVVADASAVAGLSAAWKSAMLSGVVPVPRGIVARCSLSLLDVSLPSVSVE